MRMPYWRSLSSVLAIGALIAAGAWARLTRWSWNFVTAS